MAEPLLSALTKLTEFFSPEQIEASARRSGFVQRASKITGKLFLALVTFGQWSTAKTSLAQLAAKAAQLGAPVEVSPEAIHQRMNRRALAFLQDRIRRAFAKLHTGDTVCDESLLTAFPRVHSAGQYGGWAARHSERPLPRSRRQWGASRGENSTRVGLQKPHV